ncbi:MAG: prolyl oligopeptidase family serine peptidase [Vicinamibacterales bacterium]
MRKIAIGVACLALGWFAAVQLAKMGAASDEAGLLSIDTLVDIRHPSAGTWSPDGTRIAFVWDRASVQNLYVVAVDGDTARAPVAVTSYTSGSIPDFFWSADGRSLFIARDGDLWQVSPGGGDAPRPVWTTEGGEGGITLSPDGRRVAFSRDGDLWVRALADGREQRVTTTEARESGPIWSPDGARLAFTVNSSARRSFAPAYHGSKILFTWSERLALPDAGVVTIADGRIVPVAVTDGGESAPRWIDGTRLVLNRIEKSYKAREVVVADVTSGEGRVLHRDVEDRWFNLTYNGAGPTPSPDGKWVAFVSDRDGWDHAYVVAADGGPVQQLTKGQHEVSRLAWSPDSRRIAFDSNEGGVQSRKQIAVVEIDASGTAQGTVTLTEGRGANTWPVWSPRGDRLLYGRTDPQTSPELYMVAAAGGATPVRLTDSMPASVDRSKFIEPQLISYPSRDGKPVRANLFVPPNLDRSRRHPAIVWIHGDLVTQNYDGWHIRRDYGAYYSFHQYLMQRGGYVVLAPDYRGSTGYGKDWRLGVYRDLGGNDAWDVSAGVDYLKTLGYVDTERIGVWGLSYGGFLTLRAMIITPTAFRAGIDVSGVTDWGDYVRDPGQPWLHARMGTPDDNPAQYEQGAPVRQVSTIVRPLMVLGSTADTNVPYEQSVRLVDELLKAGKDVEFMMYPGELHYFHREHVLRDAWRRVERFFDMHLRRPATSTTEP